MKKEINFLPPPTERLKLDPRSFRSPHSPNLSINILSHASLYAC